MVQVLDDKTLDDFVKQHDIVLLDIFTTWCGPCQLQARIFQELDKEIDHERVALAKLDAEKCPQTSSRFNVTAIPTLIIFKGGKPVKRFVGVQEKGHLLEEIRALQK